MEANITRNLLRSSLRYACLIFNVASSATKLPLQAARFHDSTFRLFTSHPTFSPFPSRYCLFDFAIRVHYRNITCLSSIEHLHYRRRHLWNGVFVKLEHIVPTNRDSIWEKCYASAFLFSFLFFAICHSWIVLCYSFSSSPIISQIVLMLEPNRTKFKWNGSTFALIYFRESKEGCCVTILLNDQTDWQILLCYTTVMNYHCRYARNYTHNYLLLDL